MPIPAPVLIAGGSLALKGLSKLFGGKSKKKQEKEAKRAATAGANLQQKRGEDQRRGRLQLGNSLLNGVPQTTGGGVRTNVALDPAVFEGLNAERTYDFGSTIPEGVGGSEAFLSGLFGDAADFLPEAAAAGAFGGTPNPEANVGSVGEANGALTLEQLMDLLGQRGGGSSAPPR